MGKLVKQVIAVVTSRESAHNGREIVRSALKLAHTHMSDEDARLVLREQTQEAPRAARRALKILRIARDEFDRDRAYRLLEASISDSSVQPIAPSLTELFLREEELGHKPIGEAFQCIKDLVPELDELESAVEREYRDRVDMEKSLADSQNVNHRLATMVGPAAPERLDRLARSQLALTISTQYLAILGGDSRYGDIETSFFSAPRKLYIRSGIIGGSLPGPPPPSPW